jgi:predicted ATPase
LKHFVAMAQREHPQLEMWKWRRSRNLVFWDARECAPGPQGRLNRPSSTLCSSWAAPFIGRDGELDLLKQGYADTVRERSVRLVTLFGEPGVGKSRLIHEFGRFVDDRPEFVSWRQGRCLPYGDGIAFWALGEIVKAQAGILESDPPAHVVTKLDAALQVLVGQTSEREWLRARLAPLLGLGNAEGPGADQAELFAAWRRVIEAMAADGPLVLVVEDLHWADAGLLQFLDYLLDSSAAIALLVIAAARPELLDRHPERGEGKPNASAAALSPLSDTDTAALIAALLGQPVLPPEVQTLLLERAGGNPLYAEEFARLLTDRGLLARDGRTLRLSIGNELPFPETVQALIAARLDTPSVGAQGARPRRRRGGQGLLVWGPGCHGRQRRAGTAGRA